MARSYIKSNQTTSLVSFLVKQLQPTLSTMIDVVQKEKEKEIVPYVVKVDLKLAEPVKPKVEYFTYIQRHGFPNTGIFDEQILDLIRLELGLIQELPNKYPVADGDFFPVPDTDS